MRMFSNLATTDETDDDTRTDDKRKYESIGTVPWWCPAATCCSGVRIVQEIECKELCNQCRFNRQKNCRPCDRWCKHANCIAVVSMTSTVASPFETPVDGSQKRNNLNFVRKAIICVEVY